MKTRNISFKIIIIISLIFTQFFTKGQSLSPFVVANGGSSGKNGNISLDWTVGEPCITTLTNGNLILTQGFHQPDFTQSQIIDLNAGWSGISSYLAPVNVSASSIFSQLSDNLVIAKNFSGFYWPSQNINTLGLWYEKDAFEIKVNETSVLQVTGKPLKDHSIMLNQGWNYLPVLRNCQVSIEELAGGNQNIEIIKGIASCGVYWPQFGINTIIDLHPGRGYFVKCTGDLVLNFPICNGIKQAETIQDLYNPDESPWPVVKSSPVSHLIAFPRELTIDFQTGDIVGVFSLGKCVGVTRVTSEVKQLNSAFSVTAFADDPSTAEIDGFETGVPIQLRIFSPFSGKESSLNPAWDQSLPDFDGLFALNGLSAIKSLTINSIESDHSNIEIHVVPNPTTGIFRISGIGKTQTVSILNSNGMQLKSFHKILADGLQEFDISDLPTGIFWVRVETESLTKTVKVVKY